LNEGDECEILWQTTNSRKLPTARAGLPKFDRGNLFILDSAEGSLHLLEPRPDGYKELARATMLGGKQIWAPMTLSRGRLLIRDQTQMKCLDVKKP
jgi:outer membrane protein assembly factor BamB